ncbi:ABC-F family ATP-binding cassette domain-containing protein [Candidatus Sumerlaeota bacterium]|nr:ABC-F family ATP-binding cassette domain-containing protein [Candidatus Sumerlaeota bacterium]
MLGLKDIHLSLGGRAILRGVDLTVSDGECVAVVGPNGCGKSTLLRILGGMEKPDRGEVTMPKATTLGHLPQEADLDSDRTLEEELLTAFAEIRSAMEEMTRLEERMAHTDPETPGYDRILDRYAERSHLVEHLGGYSMEAEARRVAAGLGFSLDDMSRSCREFSGGWQMRILLAKLLLRMPDVLLLDEPTNHLDLETTLWLEDWIAACKRTVILVSHERATMDRLANRIVCLEWGRADVYPGDYSHFVRESRAKREAHLESYERQQKEIAAMEAFIRRFRYNASRASLVQSRVKQLAKIERIEPPFRPHAIHFRFPKAPESWREVATLEQVGHSYGTLRVLRDIDLTIYRGEKIGLVGVNGAGKSTLLRILAGRENPTEGQYLLGQRVSLAHFAQYDTATLDSDRTLLEAIEAAAPPNEAGRARDLLGAFLFSGDDVEKPLRVLSGGERTRFRLARMLFSPANFLLLDEPTNHLDVTSRATVEEALRSYTGTVVVVSHDRVFMERVTSRIVEIENHAVRAYPGNYADYLHYKEQLVGSSSPETDAAPTPSAPIEGRNESSTKTDSKEARALERERRRRLVREMRSVEKKIEAGEREIEECEKRIAEIDREMVRPDAASDYARLTRLAEERRALERQHSQALRNWETLHNRMDELQNEE